MDPRDRARLTDDLARLSDGDRAAFDPVFTALLPCIRAFCARALSSADAEDAAQRAMEKIFARASTFDRARDALTWALAIAAWEIRTICTQRRRARLSDADPELSDDTPGPEEQVIARDLARALCEAMSTLSPTDREVVLDEVSGGPTFRKRKQRALSRLREAWRKLYGPA